MRSYRAMSRWTKRYSGVRAAAVVAMK
jgi:hypothetical protein